MKALRIAFFACVLSVFFCCTAYADNSVTLAIPYLSSVTVTESYTATVTTNGEEFVAGDIFYVDIGNTWSAFSVINYNGVNVGGANVDYSADFVIESVSAGLGVSVTRSGNRFYLKNEYADFGSDGIPLTIVYTVSAKWNRGVVPSTSNPIENCYLRTTCSVKMSAAIKFADDSPNELDTRNTIHSINSKVDDILQLLDGTSGMPPPDFLGPDAIVYFRESYFPNADSNTGSVSIQNDKFILSNASDIRMRMTGNSQAGAVLSLSPGDYYLVYTAYGNNAGFSNLVISQATITVHEELIWESTNTGISLVVVPFTVDKPFVTNAIRVTMDTAVNGLFYGGIIPIPDDTLAGNAINPDQETKRDELENLGERQAWQEETLWANVNTYKSKLDFGLDSWSDAAGGLDYVTDVFLLIWNNSPTQIITLSLMLGIGMLAIGRGVMAARRQAKDDT